MKLVPATQAFLALLILQILQVFRYYQVRRYCRALPRWGTKQTSFMIILLWSLAAKIASI